MPGYNNQMLCIVLIELHCIHPALNVFLELKNLQVLENAQNLLRSRMILGKRLERSLFNDMAATSRLKDLSVYIHVRTLSLFLLMLHTHALIQKISSNIWKIWKRMISSLGSKHLES